MKLGLHLLSGGSVFDRGCNDIKPRINVFTKSIDTQITKYCKNKDEDLYDSFTINIDFFIIHKEDYTYYHNINHVFKISGDYDYKEHSSDLASLIDSLFLIHKNCVSIKIEMLVTSNFIQ